MDVQIEPRRRAPRLNSQFTRAAVTVVRPINRQIAEWQTRVALLDALSIQPPGRASPDIAEQARTLRQAVAAQQSAFREQVASLPGEVAAESRIADTHRALDTVVAAVERILGRFESRS